jgi:hypothetical protein
VESCFGARNISCTSSPTASERSFGRVGPGGFEPPLPDPKSGVLPLDEGPPNSYELTSYEPRAGGTKANYEATKCHCEAPTVSGPGAVRGRVVVLMSV